MTTTLPDRSDSSPRPNYFARFPQLRRRLRAIHRDAGYATVGLTIVYAISGLAVNHIADWDPNYRQFNDVQALPHDLDLRFGPDLATQNEIVARTILLSMNINERPTSVYAASSHELDITLADSDVHVDLERRTITHNGQRPRFLVKTANFLHLNRGKKAWTFIADTYAGLLLVLATSGLFMVKGRSGVWGRGGIFVLIGVAVPIAYVVFSST